MDPRSNSQREKGDVTGWLAGDAIKSLHRADGGIEIA
jgi:hypothetical protein